MGTNGDWLSALTYPFRRFGNWLRDPEPACRYRWCARPTVGFSVWCREHTDRIHPGGEDISGWPRQGRVSVR